MSFSRQPFICHTEADNVIRVWTIRFLPAFFGVAHLNKAYFPGSQQQDSGFLTEWQIQKFFFCRTRWLCVSKIWNIIDSIWKGKGGQKKYKHNCGREKQGGGERDDTPLLNVWAGNLLNSD